MTKRAIQPRIIGSWSMMFQVRKLIFFGVCAMAGIASAAAAAPAPLFSTLRLVIMGRSSYTALPWALLRTLLILQAAE